MSLLLVSRASNSPDLDVERVRRRAVAAARRQGVGEPFVVSWPGGRAWWFATAGHPQGSGAMVREGDRCLAYVGTVHWKGLTGEPLLRRLLAEFVEPQAMPLREFSGAFAMFLSAGAGVWLFNDAAGIQKIYETADQGLLSTSLLVCRAALGRPVVNRLRAQEYVLVGGTHALDTPVAGVRIADPCHAHELSGAGSRMLYPAASWRMACPFKRPDEAVEAITAALVDDFTGMAAAFGPNIGMALSGGFDSRLLLAALDRVGVAPSLYVYGADSDDDVRIAAATAARLGMAIERIDKRRLNARQPLLDAQTLASNIAFFDGLPADGVFDRGADRLTRLQQVEGGRLNLNGGGGEVLRNFFYLRDRPHTAGELVGAFYSNWLPQAIASADERRAFDEAMQDGILDCLGHAAGSASARARALPRSDVELVYTLFRLRYWMGRNNTVAARYGAFLTPLALPALVSLAASLPMAWKDFGALEARVIEALSPRVAMGASGYGFDFSQGPNLAHKLKVAATQYRPLAVRRRSAPLRRLLGRLPAAGVPAEWRDALGSDATEVDWIDANFLTEGDQLNRLLSLQAVLSDTLCGVSDEA